MFPFCGWLENCRLENISAIQVLKSWCFGRRNCPSTFQSFSFPFHMAAGSLWNVLLYHLIRTKKISWRYALRLQITAYRIEGFSKETRILTMDTVHTARKLLDGEDGNKTGRNGEIIRIDAVTGQINALQLVVVTVGQTVGKLQRSETQLERILIITGTFYIRAVSSEYSVDFVTGQFLPQFIFEAAAGGASPSIRRFFLSMQWQL